MAFIAPIVAAGVGLASAIGKSIPGKQGKYNRRQLNDLLARQKSGELGLTGEERQFLTNQQMTKVGRGATETRQRQEAMLHSQPGGSSSSVGDLARAQMAEQRSVGESSLAASRNIEAAHLARQAAEEQEIEQRMAFKSAKARQAGEAWTQLGGDVAQAAVGANFLGDMGLGAFGGDGTDWQQFSNELAGRGMDAQQVDYWRNLAQTDMEEYSRQMNQLQQNQTQLPGGM